MVDMPYVVFDAYSLWECPAGHVKELPPTDADTVIHCTQWVSDQAPVCAQLMHLIASVEVVL